MTDISDPTGNPTANTGEFVGIQAGVVHDSTVYMLQYGSPPEREYEVGRQYLEGGIPLKARENIESAMARGIDTSEIIFFWVLATLSKRSYRDLEPAERDSLARILHRVRTKPDDVWKRAIEAIYALPGFPGGDLSEASAAARLRELPKFLSNMIRRHLDYVLSGSMKDEDWAEACAAAHDGQKAHSRSDRVWAYFEPRPAAARARLPQPDSATLSMRIRACTGYTLSAISFCFVAYCTLPPVYPLAALTFLFSPLLAWLGVRNGLDWRYRIQRIREKDRRYSTRPAVPVAQEEGFAAAISRTFEHYFTKYAPFGSDGMGWSLQTAGVRRALRDEVVEIYREQRINAWQLQWLVRHLVVDTRRRWLQGELFGYRQRLQVPLATKAWCVGALATLAGALGYLTYVAALQHPLGTSVALLLLAIALRYTVPLSSWIFSERRRAKDDREEYELNLRQRQEAYAAWVAKLTELMPKGCLVSRRVGAVAGCVGCRMPWCR